MNLMLAAVQAAQRGWAVHPIVPGEKLPLTRWGLTATSDLKTVAQWWTQWPTANIGLACKPSGLLVVDLDVAKQPDALRGGPWGYLHDRLGPWVDGDDCLREICQRFGGDGEYDRLMQTYRVCTASMGAHLYLRWPPNVQASQSSPVPGALDVRANGGDKGGYVLAAGSVTGKGAYAVEHDAPILDATDFPWLIELVREKPKPAKVKPLFNTPGTGSFAGLVGTVRLAQEGNRSHACYWAACSMATDGAPEEEAINLLAPAAEEAGLMYREAEATIKSAYRRMKG